MFVVSCIYANFVKLISVSTTPYLSAVALTHDFIGGLTHSLATLRPPSVSAYFFHATYHVFLIINQIKSNVNRNELNSQRAFYILKPSTKGFGFLVCPQIEPLRAAMLPEAKTCATEMVAPLGDAELNQRNAMLLLK